MWREEGGGKREEVMNCLLNGAQVSFLYFDWCYHPLSVSMNRRRFDGRFDLGISISNFGFFGAKRQKRMKWNQSNPLLQ